LEKARMYELPARLCPNEWALSGDWTVRSEALHKLNGSIAYRCHARDLHLVMGAKTPGTPLRFRMTIDGRAPGTARGGDVDENGNGIVTQQRLYQLIRQPKPITDRQFEICGDPCFHLWLTHRSQIEISGASSHFGRAPPSGRDQRPSARVLGSQAASLRFFAAARTIPGAEA